MTRELQSTLEAPGIRWPAMRSHIRCMAHILQLDFGAFMSNLGENGRTESWETHERDPRIGETESSDIGSNQRLRKRVMVESTSCRLWDQVWQRQLRKYVFQNIVKDLKLTFIPQRMLALLILLTPHCQNEIIDCQKAKVPIAVLPIMDAKTWWNSTLEWLERVYPLWEFACQWLKNPIFSDCWPLITTPDERNIVQYVMEVLRPLRYWTLCMSKTHTVTLHHVITVYNDMFDHMDGVMWALAKTKTQWKEDVYFAVEVAQQKLSTYYAEVTPVTSRMFISPDIIDRFRMLQSFMKWDKAMDINPEDETSYTTQYLDAILKCVGNEYCAKHQQMSVMKSENAPQGTNFSSSKVSEFVRVFWSVWFVQCWCRILNT